MTTNHNYNTPQAGATDWHIPLNKNFELIDTDAEIRAQASERSDYQPKQGAKFLATDTGRRFVGDGSEWVEIPYPTPDTGGQLDILYEDTTVTVEPDGSGDYSSIQTALDEMPDVLWGAGYTIRVGPGEYDESVVIPPYVAVNGQLLLLGGVAGSGSSRIRQLAASNIQGSLAIDSFKFTGPMNPIDDSNGGVLQFYNIPGGLYLGELDFANANDGDGVYTCILLYGAVNAQMGDCAFGDVNQHALRLKQGQANVYVRNGNTGSLNGYKYKVNGGMVFEEGPGTGSWSASSGPADIDTGLVVASDGQIYRTGDR
jgi:hypothetical protein